ncbi:MAG: TIM barrel protein [Candidatus Hermodarchaeota archaeon]
MSFKIGLTIQQVGTILPSVWVKLSNSISLQHVEFDPTVFDDIDNVRSALRCNSVTVHAPFIDFWPYDMSSGGKKQKLVEQFIENVNQNAKDLHIHSVVVHPPAGPSPNMDLFYEHLNNLKPLVLLENLSYLDPFSSQWSSWETFSRFYRMTNEHLDKSTGFCFDIPHSFIQNAEKFLDLPEFLITELKGRNGYIHLSGGLRTEDTHYPSLTEGEIPMNLVKRFLDQIKFRGIVNMELKPQLDRGGIVGELEKILQSYELLLGWAGAQKHRMLLNLKKHFILDKIKKVERTTRRE